MYDTIIIGGGIAGLYAFYKLKSETPTMKIVLLERGSKEELGGRMRTQEYYGEQIMMGAGVGRKRKDHLLQKLVKDLAIPTKEFKSQHYFSPELEKDQICAVRETFHAIKKAYIENPNQAPINKKKTFREFTEGALGSQKYKHFISCAGFSDYEKEGVEDTLNHYGFNDNYESWTALGINWQLLTESLYKRIGKSNIHFGKEVTKIERSVEGGGGFSISISGSENKMIIKTRRVILATTIESIRRLLPQHNKIYKEIHGQPFLRIYGAFSKETAPIMAENVKGYTIVPGSLQKIIPIQKEKGLYMIAYSDNERARSLKKYIENTPENRAILARKVERAMDLKSGSLQLESIKSFYWDIGTHYYSPLSNESNNESRTSFIERAQNPETGIYVAGEVVSRNQGWVEGALDSVEMIYKKII